MGDMFKGGSQGIEVVPGYVLGPMMMGTTTYFLLINPLSKTSWLFFGALWLEQILPITAFIVYLDLKGCLWGQDEKVGPVSAMMLVWSIVLLFYGSLMVPLSQCVD